MRDADVGALFLHPGIRPDLATQLLVNGTGVPGLGELEREGTAEEELLGGGSSAGRRRWPNRNWYAHVEAPPHPLLLRCDCDRTRARGAEVQVVSDDGSDSIALSPESPVECLFCGNVGRSSDKVLISV